MGERATEEDQSFSQEEVRSRRMIDFTRTQEVFQVGAIGKSREAFR